MSFTLCVDISVDTIIGLPFIKNMKLELGFDLEMYLSHAMKKEFEIGYDETKLSTPPEIKEASKKETVKAG